MASLLQTFSSCGDWWLLSSCGVWPSSCGDFSCCKAWVLGHMNFSTCSSWVLEDRLNSYGKRGLAALPPMSSAWLGIKPVSPGLSGGFFTTEPPERPLHTGFHLHVLFYQAQDPSLSKGTFYPRPAACLRAEPKAVHITGIPEEPGG